MLTLLIFEMCAVIESNLEISFHCHLLCTGQFDFEYLTDIQQNTALFSCGWGGGGGEVHTRISLSGMII